ncbi:hypothetical protein PAXRUDRAFT_692759 [Paxillus rubicundulus Ve08.2h10]|uniref:Uncharacterized protein n=1 Tax=Paxillus rubicundulus Ve08.2h10 TaxID=930991 RepID=A0A0D0E2V5_9AGAM|nr:hypothetical protein PAXRUDRAFT_692759 [Paxillus rubicundulus Ve08.2h10]
MFTQCDLVFRGKASPLILRAAPLGALSLRQELPLPSPSSQYKLKDVTSIIISSSQVVPVDYVLLMLLYLK